MKFKLKVERNYFKNLFVVQNDGFDDLLRSLDAFHDGWKRGIEEISCLEERWSKDDGKIHIRHLVRFGLEMDSIQESKKSLDDGIISWR